MKDFENAMAVAAQRAGDAKQNSRHGVVDAYDPNTFSVKVRLQPSGVLTGWIPIASCFVGNGWGLFAAPTIGDAVQIDCQEGELNAGAMTGSFFNDEDRPLSVPSGEFWLKHKSGSLLKFLNNGDVELVTDRDLLATVGRNLTATATGAVSVTGATIALNAAGGIALNGPMTQGLGSNGGNAHIKGPMLSDGEVTAVTTPVHAHAHGGVTPGASNTGGPIP
ncbi:phage baseplate assembly protein V [Variovorax sp. LjRoot84]|uniref:phage baseplate assembly protein V n=1 Tax=Variovorax sp. LjRoot84 TaxID=3342340 RepID=UPI003ECD5745